jgi:pimeloyl-ACP methyl ester carboxylesterase
MYVRQYFIAYADDYFPEMMRLEAHMVNAELHDGAAIDVEVDGEGPAVLLTVNPHLVEGPQADEMRKWGVDPATGRSLIDGLKDRFRVVAFDYEGHVLANPKPDTLTPANVSRDLLAIADSAGADRFAYYGYSWLAVCGLQLAIRTDRLAALVMGGYPPIDGPYADMRRVTTATHRMSVSPRPAPNPAPTTGDGVPDWSSVEVSLPEPQTRQFVTLYQALEGFDDRAAQASIHCPRMCFIGSADQIQYDERWDDVRVDMAAPVIHRRAELEALGWQVHVLDGLDHTQAMQAANVLPILRPWLTSTLAD